MASDEDRALLEEFITESRENLLRVEKQLLALEGTPDAETVNDLFRAIHSVKGAAGFFHLSVLGGTAHAAENLLSRVREGVVSVTRPLIDLLLETTDRLLEMLDKKDLGASESNGELVERLHAAAGRSGTGNALTEPSGPVVPEPPAEAIQAALLAGSGNGKILYGLTADKEYVGTMDDASFNTCFSERCDGVIREVSRSGSPADVFAGGYMYIFVESVLEAGMLVELLQTDRAHCRPITALAQSASPSVNLPTQSAETASPAVARVHSSVVKHADGGRTAGSGATIRIGVDVLDELLELIGEVVLGRNQLLTRYEDDVAFKSVSQSISRLHQHMIRTRMQSVGTLFEKYRRTIRDLSQTLGKKVELTIEGADIELDRTILEGLSDPLTHLVRNAIDHGLESPEERSASGKQVVGTVALRALHESGQILIEVEDDGRGIDTDRVRSKAVSSGLISEEEASGLSEKELAAFIFHPGLSTKESVSEISGRGVGMDVVKTNLEKLGCMVEVSSRKSRGTVVSISIPLTQAVVNSSVISGLIVGIGEHTLAIPQLAVNEIIRLAGSDRARLISRVQDREVFTLRDRVIPLVHLEDILDIKRTYCAPDGDIGPDRRKQFGDRRAATTETESTSRPRGADRRRRGEIFIVLQFKQNWFGILVDRIVGTEEIVVRRPPDLLKFRRVFAGVTILGNGTVSLILDIGGMVELADLDFAARSRALSAHMRRSSLREIEQRVVIFSYSDDEYFALPVNLLSEVDRFAIHEIRRVGSREFLQRHGETIPLLRLEKHLDVTPMPTDRASCIVLTPSHISFPTGIVAGRIVGTSVLDETISTKDADEKGIMGTFFRDGKLVSLLDIYTLLQKSDPTRYKSEVGADLQNCRILFAEDQLFFRQLVTQYFRSHGIRSITAVPDGRKALEALQNNPDAFDVVVSDIEMPVMDGYQFVSLVKSDPKLRHLPVMALTSLDAEADRQRGMEAGFDAYEVKLDKDKVIRCLDRLYVASH